MKKDQKNKKPLGGTRKIVLSIGIAILFVMFVGFAIETVYPSPEYDDFCDYSSIGKNIYETNEKLCVEQGGVWTNYTYDESKTLPEQEVTGYCDFYSECSKEYDSYKKNYDRNLFFIALVVGILTFVIAVFLLVEAVSSGFMGGGILTIIYGTIRNWNSLSNLWRTIMLGLALAVLVWIGYKKLER